MTTKLRHAPGSSVSRVLDFVVPLRKLHGTLLAGCPEAKELASRGITADWDWCSGRERDSRQISSCMPKFSDAIAICD